MLDMKSFCVTCHSLLFFFGSFLLIIFGIFALFDFGAFQNEAFGESKFKNALCYWIAAFLHLGGAIGLSIYGCRIRPKRPQEMFFNEEIHIKEELQNQISSDEILPREDDRSISSEIIGSINQ